MEMFQPSLIRETNFSPIRNLTSKVRDQRRNPSSIFQNNLKDVEYRMKRDSILKGRSNPTKNPNHIHVESRNRKPDTMSAGKANHKESKERMESSMDRDKKKVAENVVHPGWFLLGDQGIEILESSLGSENKIVAGDKLPVENAASLGITENVAAMEEIGNKRNPVLFDSLKQQTNIKILEEEQRKESQLKASIEEDHIVAEPNKIKTFSKSALYAPLQSLVKSKDLQLEFSSENQNVDLSIESKEKILKFSGASQSDLDSSGDKSQFQNQNKSEFIKDFGKVDKEAGLAFSNQNSIESTNFKDIGKESSEFKLSEKTDFQDILGKVKIMLNSKKSEMVMKLKPEHLGKLEFKIQKLGDQMVVKIAVESLIVKEALESQMGVLQRGLQEQGLQMQSIDITVSQKAGDGTSFAFQERGQEDLQTFKQEKSQDQLIKEETEEGMFINNNSASNELSIYA